MIKLKKEIATVEVTQFEIKNDESITSDSVAQKDTPMLQLPEVISLYADSEFNQRIDNGMIITGVPVYCPEMDAIECFSRNELDADFNLISALLERQGFKVGEINRIQLEDKLNKLWKKAYTTFTKKSYSNFIKEILVVAEFEKIGLDIERCQIEYSKKKRKLYVKFKSVECNFQFFFAYADLFRIFGSNHNVIWYERAKLTQFRTIKVMGKVKISLLVDGVPTDFDISIFDNRYCFPPIKGSLEAQAKTFGVDKYLERLSTQSKNETILRLIETSKNKIHVSDLINARYNDRVTEQWCKENMDIVQEKYPDIHNEYAMMDCLVTWGLSQALKDMLAQVCNLLEIENLDLSETCGKNIQNILLKLIEKHFGIDEDFTSKDLLNLIGLGRSENLEKIDGNQYGIVASGVVGGLLFSRTARYPLIKGCLFDLDLKSCYATALTSMNLYLGEPVHITFKYDKPSLKRVVELIDKRKIPDDGWMIQASGILEKAVNTLVLSDSLFDKNEDILSDRKRYSMPDEIDLEDESINLIDAEKLSEPNALSKIATKEINGGKFTKATLTALSDLPTELYEEFLNLKVDAIIYFEPSLMCESLDELQQKKENLAGSNAISETLTDDLQKITVTKLSPNNCSLKFPIWKYYKTVAELRGKMKKAGNPVQEIFKLVLNSTYGILASLVMKVNNPIAANWITSCARGAAWRMTNACNGFNPITDGTAISSKNIPFDMTFHQVLKKYPDYLENFQPEIINNGELNFTSESDFNDFYIEHLEKFIGKSDWLTKMYAYDLKDEGTPKNYHYDKHYNTNAGNYLKEGEWGNKLKCRSYRATEELQNWFKECCKGEYTRHFIYADKSILKLSQGSIDAMRILKDSENVANRNKTELRMPSDLAEKIAIDGICHPMGFSKYEVKVMKLISTSQFLTKDFRQMKLLMSFYEECKNISKYLLPSENWKSKLSTKIIEEFPIVTSDGNIVNVEFREDLNYEKYNQFNPIGLGFELLMWGNRELKTLADVRNRFIEIIAEYNVGDDKWNIRHSLNWNRVKENLETSLYLKHFFAAVQIAKLNYEIDYRTTLANSVNDPMSRIQFLGDITTLKYEKSKNL